MSDTKRTNSGRINLQPLSPEQALAAALNTPLKKQSAKPKPDKATRKKKHGSRKKAT